MKTIPMIFNAEMVQALLDGRKVQTRRKFTESNKKLFSYAAQSGECSFFIEGNPLHENDHSYALQFAPVQVGDLIYVRETFAPADCRTAYRADKEDGIHCMVDRWIPSIHMPRSESRLTLNVTGVRVEKVQDITEDDAKKEGLRFHRLYNEWGGVEVHPASSKELPQWRWYETPKRAFAYLWKSIYGESWENNDWVWVIDFEVINKNIDQFIFERSAKGEVTA